MKTLAYRLTPGQDLKKELCNIVVNESIQAGCILSCAGSLSQVSLRLAGGDKFLNLKKDFEIVSLSGTLSPDGLHLHISLSDDEGNTIGGHLLENNLILTTAEIVIGVLPEFYFSRENDPDTGWKELIISENILF